MEGIKHITHEHPLILSNYNHPPVNTHCGCCSEPILINTSSYRCTLQSITTTHDDSPCKTFFLHKTCAHLPLVIQHRGDTDHVLALTSAPYRDCLVCFKNVGFWKYVCTRGHSYTVCLKCAFLQQRRQLDHPSHNHTLTLLPLKALHVCTACGQQGINDYSYLCQTCFYWIHKRCASAPAQLIRDDHDHPLVLAYSLPKEYRRYGVSCYLCPEEVNSFYWLYYCAGCRYFAHIHCALSAAKSGKDDDEEDVEGSNLVHLPISDNQPDLLYQLIQQFAKDQFNTSTAADKISQCRNGHPLILFANFNNKNVVETSSTGDERICDGCVQPLLSPPNPFYGCPDCNFFLHTVCATELPREIQYALHPGKEIARLTRFYETRKPLNLHTCFVCEKACNGILYSDESNEYWVDIGCAALPSKMKHDSHKHTLHLLSTRLWRRRCRGCKNRVEGIHFGCTACDYHIHVMCARKARTIKHKWDEHQLSLMYRPAKGHPQDFDCELCSEDIDPNYWFYHCRKCDTSFHTPCVDQNFYTNIKYGGIVKDESLHEHSLQIIGTKQEFKCGKCGRAQFCISYFGTDEKHLKFFMKPFLTCVSCKFFVCMNCSGGTCSGSLLKYYHQHQLIFYK